MQHLYSSGFPTVTHASAVVVQREEASGGIYRCNEVCRPQRRLDVRDAANGKPIPKAYIKVYAKLKNGQIRFYKDGYTDLRGRFDYASLNTNTDAPTPPPIRPLDNDISAETSDNFTHQMLTPAELGVVEKLALMILSESNGTTVREANPPAE